MRKKEVPYVMFGNSVTTKAIGCWKSERFTGAMEVHIGRIDDGRISGEYITLYFLDKVNLDEFIRILESAREEMDG